MTTETVSPQQAPVSFAAAQKVVQGLFEIMDELVAVIDRETSVVRAGRLREARALEQKKTELAQNYTALANGLKTSGALSALPPDLFKDLHRRHDLFHALVQVNLTVLATAHAVSESIMRGVSDELTRKNAPQTYGASGRQNAPATHAAQPLAISRVL